MKTRQAIYKYRICWKSKRTGLIGHSKPIFDTFIEANGIVQKLDDTYFNDWVEKVEVTEPQKEVA